MATPIVSLSEEDASWMQWDPNVETVWPEAAARSPQTTPSPPAPIEEEPSVELSWRNYKPRLAPTATDRDDRLSSKGGKGDRDARAISLENGGGATEA
ncbi:hypothetical protein FANTH_846 [Fusarium anthophilum]|uniref:Uncharacterized protein n=1 Tax=Fusarium anthophilum TaxID=48485 RepID=A0A8H5EC28_9HYPO|nr:hypothetical protein FANTH_846 [Fusarium anthophilum]